MTRTGEIRIVDSKKNILMSNNVRVNVQGIRKGDNVVTYSTMKDEEGRYHESFTNSKIECVIKTKCTNGEVEMVHLDHLWVTPYHPIIDLANDEKDWKYPISKGTSQNISCPYMYSFIVENRQALMIDRHVFATYGHNCVDQDVIQHDYFGKGL